MNRDAMLQHMEEVRAELNILDQQRDALETLLRGYEVWLKAFPESGAKLQRQLRLGVPGRGGAPLGSVSFRKGLMEVMRQARGEPLIDDEIWRRMQALGVKSQSKHPQGFIGLWAGRLDPMEKVAARTWRWNDILAATQTKSGESH